MNSGHLTDQAVTFRSINATAAGTSVINGNALDTQGAGGMIGGADAVRGVVAIGALTASQVTAAKLQDSPDNSVWTDVAGSQTGNMADGDSNKLLITDKIKFVQRFVRLVVLRATANAVIDSGVIELYRVRSAKVTQDTTVSKSITA